MLLPTPKALIGPKPNRHSLIPLLIPPPRNGPISPHIQDQLWVTSGQPGSPLRKGPAPPGRVHLQGVSSILTQKRYCI